MRFFLFLYIFLTIKTVYSQVVIEGKIVENFSCEAIPYASVYIENSNIGTISNSDGFFKLIIQDTLYSKNIVISCLGYKKKVYNFNQIISNRLVKLDTVSITLKEVNIISFSNSYLYNLVQNSLDKRRKERFIESTSKSYIKIITLEDDHPVEIIEALGQSFINNLDGLINITLKNGRIEYSNEYDTFLNLNFIRTITSYSAFRIKPKNSLFPSSICNLRKKIAKNLYLFNFNKKINYKAENVISIKCINNKTRNYLNTVIEIGQKSKEVYSLHNYGYVIPNTVFRPFKKNQRIDSLYIDFKLLFKNSPDDSSYLKMIKLEYRLNYYFDTLKMRKIHSIIIVNMFDYNNTFYLPKLEFSKVDNDYVKINTLHFDHIFWKNNLFYAVSNDEKKLTDSLLLNGNLINYSNNKNSFPVSINQFIRWSDDKKLTWYDINKNSRLNPVIISNSISYKNREFNDDLYDINFQIYLDVYKLSNRYRIFTETLFSKNRSFYYLTRNKSALEYINLYFNIFEVGRRKIIKKISETNNLNIHKIDSIYSLENNILSNRIKKFKKEVRKGGDKEKMVEWSNKINYELNEIRDRGIIVK